MANNCLKKPSKRITFRKKFKIQRKAREHSKKLKKIDKKSGRKNKRKEKLCSIPNKCPFKIDLIKEAKTIQKQLREEIKEKKLKLKEINKVLNNKNEENLEEKIPIFTNLFRRDLKEIEGNERVDSDLKKARKKIKRMRKRTNKAADKLADDFSVVMEL
uniref:Guanine nucleotide-binding protein-like 3 N-terminal domain-containing protein n=1 Tax=Meloidogyne incognita TaxID=6306 RepID=A0A914L1C9_MELIC